MNHRILLIGCGAIAEQFYLPALARRPAWISGVTLADRDLARASELASRFGAAGATADFHGALADCQGAIVATPHASHFPIAKACLEAGLHVLCEKPLTETVEQGRALVDLARNKGVTLAVNQTRRLFPASIEIKRRIDAGELGAVRSISYVEGGVFNWPTVSGFYFESTDHPRGVLLDRGAHVLDLICWWLGGLPQVRQSLNDSDGGPESVAHVELEKAGVEITVRLSWLTKLANTCEVIGERGVLSQSIYEINRLRWSPVDGAARLITLPSRARSQPELSHDLVASFYDSMAGGAKPRAPGGEVLDSLELLDACYSQATRFSLPWNDVLMGAYGQ